MRSASSARAVSITIGTSLVAPQLAADVEAGAVGEHQVEQNQVGNDFARPA